MTNVLILSTAKVKKIGIIDDKQEKIASLKHKKRTLRIQKKSVNKKINYQTEFPFNYHQNGRFYRYIVLNNSFKFA